MKLIKGTHKNNSSHPSILHFSLNKVATQYVKSILRRCAVENGMVTVGIHDYAFNSDFPYLDLLSAEEMEEYRYLFKPAGCLYSVFGGMIDGIPDLEKYKVVFVARDPRDLLVSNYYSMAHSHSAPTGEKREAFMLERVKALLMSMLVLTVTGCTMLSRDIRIYCLIDIQMFI